MNSQTSPSYCFLFDRKAAPQPKNPGLLSRRAPVWLPLALITVCIQSAGCDDSDAAPDLAEQEGPTAISAISSLYEPCLGKGVDQSETRTLATCITFPDIERTSVPFAERHFDEFAISSRSELNHKLGISAEVAAKSLWGSASASTSSFKEVEFDETSFYWLVHAKYELAHESLATNDSHFDLTHRAKEILRDHGWAGFQRACGSHFYAGRRLGARYSLLYEFRDRHDRFVKNLSAKAAVSVFGIGASAEFSEALATANERHAMSIHSDIVGGDHRISDYAERPERLREELAILRQSLGERGQGVVLSWHKLPYDIFPEVQAAKEAIAGDAQLHVAVDDVLAEFYTRFEDNREKSTRLRRARADSEGNEPLAVYSPQQLQEIEEKMTQLGSQNVAIAKRATACIREATPEACSLANLALVDGTPPRPLRDLSGLGDWSVHLNPDLWFHTDSRPTHGSTFMDFFVLPPDPKSPWRYYKTLLKVMQGPDEQVHACAGSGRCYCPIGPAHLNRPRPGVTQTAVCTGPASDLCSLRFVEREGLAPDGLPNADLLLTIYDDKGRVLHKNFFYPTFI